VAASAFEGCNVSSNIEHALLTRVIDDRDFHSIERAQITEDYFATPEAREIFRYLKGVFQDPATFGHVPSRDMTRMRFPSFYPVDAPDTVPVLCSYLRQEKVRMETLRLAQELHVTADKDPGAAVSLLRAESSRIAQFQTVGQDLSLANAFQQIKERYERSSNSGGLIGVPYPWAPLNEATQGLKPGNWVVLYARPKQKKTWLALNMAVHAYLAARRRVLVMSMEMQPLELMMRIAALVAKVDYDAFLKGKLQPHLRDHLFAILQDLIEDEKVAGLTGANPCLVVTKAEGSSGVGWLRAKIREIQPHLVIVDGLYMMMDDRTKQSSADWKQLTHISRDLKMTANDNGIPLVGVTQANRSAEKGKGTDVTELAYADALGQDADAVFRTNKKNWIDDAGIEHEENTVTAAALREGIFPGMVIKSQCATNFDFVRLLTPQDFDDDSEPQKKEYGGQQRSTFRRGGPADPKLPMPQR
jgi:replicative DNA helicase